MPPLFKRQLGIIDLGSNSVRLSVMHYTPGEAFKLAREVTRRVRLSEGMAEKNMLQEAAMARTITALSLLREVCAEAGVTRIVSVATAAVRAARNRAEFLRRVRAATDLKLKVLSGTEEAALGVLAALNGLGLRDGVMMEIGGGSVQVSIVQQGAVTQNATALLGAVRLTEMFLKGDPVSMAECAQAIEHTAETFNSWEWMRLEPPGQLMVMGGTARMLAAVDRDLRGYPLELINGYELELTRLEGLIDILCELPLAERSRRIPGLKTDRADIILAGALVLVTAMKRVGAERVIVCSQGIRDGVFYREFLRDAPSPLIPDLRQFSVQNARRWYVPHTSATSPVAQLAVKLFDQLAPLHNYGPVEREQVWAIAQCIELGTLLDFRDPYRHAAYLLTSGGLPGYTHREIAMMALVLLSLRPGAVTNVPTDMFSGQEAAEWVGRLGVLLRLAITLNSHYLDTITTAHLERKDDHLRLKVQAKRDITWELTEARKVADDFALVFGYPLEIEG